jgi:uncharacterized protein YndB with AHSA1/START domain
MKNANSSKRATVVTPKHVTRPRIKIERTFRVPVERVWKLWTTKKGIEAWWGPEGFAVKVRKRDVRPGGELRYEMTATAPEQIEFMKTAGMPLTTASRIVFSEVVPPHHLVFRQLADFIPGVAPYHVGTTVDLIQRPKGAKIVLTFDAMHDKGWTERSVVGRKSELNKLAKVLGP